MRQNLTPEGKTEWAGEADIGQLCKMTLGKQRKTKNDGKCSVAGHLILYQEASTIKEENMEAWEELLKYSSVAVGT